MSETAENKNTIHQGRNVRLVRQFKGLSQEALAYMLNKQQSEISNIESQVNLDDEILEQIALALDVSADFLKSFDFEETAKNYYNQSTNTINAAENSHDEVNLNQGEQNYYFSIEKFNELNDKFLKLQKELLEENHVLDKENALLKQELDSLKNKK